MGREANHWEGGGEEGYRSSRHQLSHRFTRRGGEETGELEKCPWIQPLGGRQKRFSIKMLG